MEQRKVLITGASIAGPCLAYWLKKNDFEVVVAEKSPKFRTGGQNIDIRGAAQKVVEMMGLREKIEENGTHEKGLQFVYEDNSPAGIFPAQSETSFTADIEILRGKLSKVFYDATKDGVEYRFGQSIKNLKQGKDSASVHFEDGSKEEFDLVISAEGIGSSTRKMILSDRVKIDYLGLQTAYFAIPKTEADDFWARWYVALGAKNVFLRPGTSDTMTVAVNFACEEEDLASHRPAEQKKIVRKLLADTGWISERILRHLDDDEDFYFGPLSQVKAETWSRGRFALVGDAAHAPSPLTGMGTSLSILGAYILAGELGRTADHRQAFRNYEQLFFDHVKENQKIFPGMIRAFYPRTKTGVKLFNTATEVAASKPVQGLISLLPHEKASAGEDDFKLPSYEMIEEAR